MERLQKELIANREYLQSIIQDLEAANEELQSANEEILSSNEELQSTNEELDTAKEELQSTNEELNTLNEELHGRNEELARINSDLINLLHGVHMAIVIVSSDLRIRRFTPMAERVLNLIPGDVGRPIGQIKPNINCPDLEQLILEVIDTINVQSREVQDAQGRTYSLTVRPYKNVENRIDGAVLVLIDVEETRRTTDEAQDARLYAEAIFNTVREPLVVLDRDLRVERANPAFYNAFRLAKADVERRLFCELSEGMFNIDRLRTTLQEVLTDNHPFQQLEIDHEFARIGNKRMILSGRRISGTDKRPALILLALDEVS
jgi:two-component system CheB/CheR fusion protein